MENNYNNNNDKLNDDCKDITLDNIKKKDTKTNLSISSKELRKLSREQYEEYLFSTGIYLKQNSSKKISDSTLNFNEPFSIYQNKNINSNISSNNRNNNQYQNYLNNNQFQNSNMINNNQNMPNYFLNNFPQQYNNTLKLGNYNENPPYYQNQNNYLYSQNSLYYPNNMNYMYNINSMNNYMYPIQRNNNKRHTVQINPTQFHLNFINSNEAINKNIPNNFNKRQTINYKPDFQFNNYNKNKIKEENNIIEENNSLSNKTLKESDNENDNDNNDFKFSFSRGDDIFDNLKETIEILQADIKNNQQQNNNNQDKKNPQEKSISAQTNHESKNVIEEKDNNKNNMNEENKNKEEKKREDEDEFPFLIKNKTISSLNEELDESAQMLEDFPKDIHNHPLIKQSFQNEKCEICLNQKTSENGYKCQKCQLIICEECASKIRYNYYYSNTKHQHSLFLSNEDDCKCNNCKKKLICKKDFYFYCKECTFYICLKCYYPERNEEIEKEGEKVEENEDDNEYEEEEDEPMHNHPLKNISKQKDLKCKLCCNEIEAGYKCIYCELSLCQECSSFIYCHKKRRDLHNHSLFLKVGIDWKCEKCKTSFKEKISFNCTDCSLYYCIDCILG